MGRKRKAGPLARGPGKRKGVRGKGKEKGTSAAEPQGSSYGEAISLLDSSDEESTGDGGVIAASVTATKRSHMDMEGAETVLFHYPPEVLADDRIAVYGKDVATAEDGKFLNDSLLDLSMKHMHREPSWGWPQKAVELVDGDNVYMLTSLFFTMLINSPLEHFDVGYDRVRTWTKHVDIFEKKFLFIPVNGGLHWSLAVLTNLDKLKASKDDCTTGDPDEERPCLLFFDSLDLHESSMIYSYLKRFLEKKWRESGRGDITLNQTTFPIVLPNVPKQENNFDCGVYTLRYAQEILHQWPRVTSASIKDGLASFFHQGLFSSLDITLERFKLRQLLRECKTRHDQGGHIVGRKRKASDLPDVGRKKRLRGF